MNAHGRVREAGVRGFTLLEVMLAIMLLALLLAGTYGSIRTAVKAMHSGEQAIDRTNRLRVAEEFVRRQVSRIMPLSFGEDESTNTRFVFQGSKDFMRFVAPMPGYLSKGGPYVQTLSFAGNRRGGKQLLFTDAMLNGFDLDQKQGDTEPSILLDQIEDGRFQYRTLDDQGRAVQLIRAQSGHLDYDSEANDLVVSLQKAQVEYRDGKDPEDFTEPLLVGSSGLSRPIRLSLDRMFSRSGVRQKLPWMTYAELRAEQARLAAQEVPAAAAQQHARDQMKVTLTIQEKFNTALAVLSFALLAIPLGIKVSRRETSANLGVAVLLALGYYFLTTAVSWIDRHPEYRPDLLMWLPNAIFLTLGLRLFSRIEKR